MKKLIALFLFGLLAPHHHLFAQDNAAVTGIVRDEKGTVLAGASVLAENAKAKFSASTLSGENGIFSFAKLPPGGPYSFSISYVGFETQTVSGYQVREGGKITLDIRMKTAAGISGEVVVIGYGTQKKSSLTGAVASVSSAEMQKLSVGNLGAAIQGQTPGVSVTTDGGIAGGAVNILIRGAGSLTNVSPLYVIDGAFASNLNGINVHDIESLEILKDAAAAAIYGSRAANGVVLVTTKKGKAGELKVNLNSSYGLQTPSKYLSFINATQYAALINQVAAGEGKAVPSRAGAGFNPAINEDYQKEWFGNAPMYSLGLDFSGGQKGSTYYTSFNYFSQKSILAFSDFKRYDVRLNTTQKKNRFKIEEDIGINRTENKPNYAYSGAAYGFDIPILPSKNPNAAQWGANSNGYAGTNSLVGQYFLVPGPSSNPLYTTSNMLATGALSNFRENATIITGGAKASYELLKGLVYSLGVNGFYQVSNAVYDIPNFTLLDIDGSNPSVQNRNFSESRGEYFQYNMDNLLSYRQAFNKHDIDVLLGQSWLAESSRTTTNTAGPGNFVSNAITTPQGNVATSGYQYGSGLLSYFGRVNYNYDGRYLLSVSARRDASSKFAKANRVGVFPSISAGWNIHRESFFKSKFISLAKLRASYGELGANFIPPYSFVSTIRAAVPVILGDQSRALGTITELANPDLKWETSKTINAGIELGFLDNRISFSADYFYKKNTDLLASLTPPPSSGRGLDISNSSYYVNSASVRNRGIELSLGYHKPSGAFTYDITANLSHVDNEVLALGRNVQPILGFQYSGSFSDAPTITKPGLPVGAFWGYQATGIYQHDADVPATGIDKGKKAGDLIFDPKGKTFLGSPFPKLEYGLNFSGNYRAFDFTVYFIGSQGNKIFNTSKYSSYFLTTRAKTTDVLNAWTPSHTNTSLPRIATQNVFGYDALPNSFYVEDGSYLRLKNVQLGYTLSKATRKKMPVERIRAYIGVQNLFTITHYSGYDPEVAVIPFETLNKAATGGRAADVNILFNRGVDSRAYPRDRTYTMGIQLSF